MNIFGLGNYSCLHFVNLFRCKRLTGIVCVCQVSWFITGSYWCSRNHKLCSVNSPSEAGSSAVFLTVPSMQKQKRN